MTRDEIQKGITDKIVENGYNGIVDVSPRVGKSKIVIDALNQRDNKSDVLILAPYNTILESWDVELEKWAFEPAIDKYNQRSVEKIDLDRYNLIILDECHSLSPAQLEVLKTSKALKLGLSGSISQDSYDTLRINLGLKQIAYYSVEDAIRDGIVADYEINIVYLPLDDSEKYIEGGTKLKPFNTTEKKHYQYLTKMVNRFMFSKKKNEGLIQGWLGRRSRAIYSYKSKIELTRKLINKFDEKKLVFTTLTDNELTEYSYHSKSNGDELDMFIDGYINELTVLNMVSMGKLCPCS